MATVSTRLYQSAHGRNPRGYGMWMFDRRHADGTTADQPVTRTGTYTEAKRALPAGSWVVLP
jgi:hypothetical protein